MTVEIILPAATQNLVTNPSFENGLTAPYVANGGSLAVNKATAAMGYTSLAHTPSAAVNSGHYLPITLLTTTVYTFSVYVRGTAGVPLQIYAYDSVAGVVLGSAVTFAAAAGGKFVRYSVTFTTGANTAIRLYVEKNNSASTGVIYTDAWQCEKLSYLTTYCDGDLPGCLWDGLRQASTSSRTSQERSGGRIIDLASYNVAISELHGMNLPPVEHHAEMYANMAGGELSSIKIQPRVIQLVCTTETSTESTMYDALKSLQALITPSRTGKLQPLILRYTRTTNTVELQCYYDSGLEGAFVQRGYAQFMLRLIAYDPYWRRDQDYQSALNYFGYNASKKYLIFRKNNVWSCAEGLAATTMVSVNALLWADDGYIYIGGDFTNLQGNANCDYFARFNTTTKLFEPINAAACNGVVYDIKQMTDGTILVGGAFTSLGGVAVNNICKVSGDTVTALGAGTNGAVRTILVHSNNQIFIGGDFTTADGGAANRVAKWIGASWQPLAGGLNNSVRSLAEEPSTGILYACGAFTQEVVALTSLKFLAQWDVNLTTPAWAIVGNNDHQGASHNTFNKILFGPDGFGYICGDIERAGGVATKGIAKFTGSTFEALSGGLKAYAAPGIFQFDPDGNLWMSGNGLSVMPTTLPGYNALGVYDGYNWHMAPVHYVLLNIASAVSFRPNGDMVIADTDPNLNQIWPGLGIMAINGDAPLFPRIVVKRLLDNGYSLYIRRIANLTTGDELYLNVPIAANETITIDLGRPDKRISSSFRGAVNATFLPGSRTSSFRLMPGVFNYLEITVMHKDSPMDLTNYFEVNAVYRAAYEGVPAAN